jgi:mono/diheme cytochrome c family protein
VCGLVAAAFALTSLAAQSAGPARSEGELRAFYQRSCTNCHGVDGSARSSDGRKLKGRDFTAENVMQGRSDQELIKVIRRGVTFGLIMPSFQSDLSEEEALILVRDVLRKARKGMPIDPQSQPERLARIQATPLAGPR